MHPHSVGKGNGRVKAERGLHRRMINSTHTAAKKMDHHDTNHADGLGRQLPQDLKFCLLADKPHLSPSLAQWFYHEWPETYHVKQ